MGDHRRAWIAPEGKPEFITDFKFMLATDPWYQDLVAALARPASPANPSLPLSSVGARAADAATPALTLGAITGSVRSGHAACTACKPDFHLTPTTLQSGRTAQVEAFSRCGPFAFLATVPPPR